MKFSKLESSLVAFRIIEKSQSRKYFEQRKRENKSCLVIVYVGRECKILMVEFFLFNFLVLVQNLHEVLGCIK